MIRIFSVEGRVGRAWASALARLVLFGGALYSALALAFGAASTADLKAALRR